MTLTGFTFPYRDHEVFVASFRKKKCDSLAKQILRKMLLPDAPQIREELLYWTRKADLEETENCIIINGKGFTICDPQKTTEIIYL